MKGTMNVVTGKEGQKEKQDLGVFIITPGTFTRHRKLEGCQAGERKLGKSF